MQNEATREIKYQDKNIVFYKYFQQINSLQDNNSDRLNFTNDVCKFQYCKPLLKNKACI